jgi:hypothetical protein
MNKTSDKVVCDYINNMFMDLALSESISEPALDQVRDYVPLDSVVTGYQIVPCMDPFNLMTVENTGSHENIWLAYLSILNLSKGLPGGYLKQYCLRQCLTLKAQLDNRGLH